MHVGPSVTVVSGRRRYVASSWKGGLTDVWSDYKRERSRRRLEVVGELYRAFWAASIGVEVAAKVLRF